MTRVDFYILSQPPSAMLPFVCRLMTKAYPQAKQIYIHTQSSTEATQLDQLLWTFNDDSFIPHSLSKKDNPDPIQIGYTEAQWSEIELYINLTMDIPQQYQQCSRIIEVVPEENQWKALARKKYQFYRQQQWQVQTHTL